MPQVTESKVRTGKQKYIFAGIFAVCIGVFAVAAIVWYVSDQARRENSEYTQIIAQTSSLEDVHQYDKAIDSLKKYLGKKHTPVHEYQGRVALGYCYGLKGDKGNSFNELKQADAMNVIDDDVMVSANIAGGYLAKGDKQNAAKYTQKAIDQARSSKNQTYIPLIPGFEADLAVEKGSK